MIEIPYHEVLNRASVEAPEYTSYEALAEELGVVGIEYNPKEDKFPCLMQKPIDSWSSGGDSCNTYLISFDGQPVAVLQQHITDLYHGYDQFFWVSVAAETVRGYLKTLVKQENNNHKLSYITPETVFEIKGGLEDK